MASKEHLINASVGDRVAVIGHMDQDSRIKPDVAGKVVDLDTPTWPGIDIGGGDIIHVPLYNLRAA